MRDHWPNVATQPGAPPISQGVARLLERIWQPAQLDDPGAWHIEDEAAAAEAARILEADPCRIDKAPDADDEALAWQDSVTRADVAVMPGAYEIARLVIVEQGAGVLERIQTWARIAAMDPRTGQPIWETELRAPADSFSAFAVPGAPGPTTSSSAPFIFPLAHPTGTPLSIRWSLRVDRLGIDDRPAVAWLAGAAPDGLPIGDRIAHLPADWTDNRYCWGTLYAKGQQWVIGGYSLVRLFATVLGDPTLWRVSVGGRLTGYTQNIGRRDAVFGNVTRRA